MARSLLRHGADVMGLDLRPEAQTAFKQAGGRIAGDLRMLAHWAEVVAICVLNDTQVKSLLQGADGLFANLSPGSVIIIHSTISPDMIISLAREATEFGHHLVDAPVSGKSMQARETGALAVFVGATPDAYARALPVLRGVGSSIEHVGPVGNGQICKLCNNLMLFSNTLGSLEAARLAGAWGIPEAQMVRTALEGSARSWSLQEWGYLDRMRQDHPLADDPEELLDFLAKDIALAISAANLRSLELRLAPHLLRILHEVLLERWGEKVKISG